MENITDFSLKNIDLPPKKGSSVTAKVSEKKDSPV